jgi:hypothetical protein
MKRQLQDYSKTITTIGDEDDVNRDVELRKQLAEVKLKL